MFDLFFRKDNSEFFEKFTISGKKDLETVGWQEKLKEYHPISGNRVIKCGCNKYNNLWLSCCKMGNGFFLKNYPNQNEHEPECIFGVVRTFVDDNNVFSARIFDETKIDNKTERKPIDRDNYEKGKNATFSIFCTDIIKKANVRAFKNANKNKTFIANNTSWKDLQAGILNAPLEKVKMQKGDKGVELNFSNLANSLKKQNIYLNFGITYNTCEEIIENMNIQLENMNFPLQFNGFDKEKELDRIKYALRHLVIYDNYIKPPFFCIITNRKSKILRLFITPCFYDKKTDNFCFVDSNAERVFAQSLVEQRKCFFKPLTGIDFNSLPGLKYQNVANRPYYPLLEIPDFFVFDENGDNIIIELTSHINADRYDRKLEEKEKSYNSLKHFKYKRVEIKSLKI